MISCVIRRANPEDAGAIQHLYQELVGDPLIQVLPEQIVTMGRSASTFLLVAESGDSVFGTVLFNLRNDVMFRSQPFGVLENVVVSSAARQQGIGTRLLAQVEVLAKEHDCTKIMLLSSVRRHGAHAFFRHCGFASDTKTAFVKYRSQFTTA
ncbi:GNAT family N-acetyltransferase [Luteolibacter sp. GHJ8]|uniref:GNAT family N-acetyltransferase n=1 Tax=Luteolibacter rhizosphaerae TaxID=2989719 RepID=A0ABT3G877_9BACT|nr:GNAT family N-acetyltransferase [Luteolibacter rhizosphaerae]MCW1915789.1 GNAT family N-acetyltransferase [Luteolibacter rhizosphaerae]